MLLTSVHAAADSITVSNPTLSSTVTEGSSFDVTVTLNIVATGANQYSIADFTAAAVQYKSGDAGDKPTQGATGGTCPAGNFTAETFSCTIIYHFTTTLPAADNSDSAVYNFVYPEYVLNNNVGGGVAYSGLPQTDVITISDPSPNGSPVPEPSTVILLGGGLLGLRRWVHRRHLT